MVSVSHNFSLTGDHMRPEVYGIDGVLAQYRSVLPQLKFGGPTRFGPILEEFRQHVLSNAGQPIYSVLLIVTDGSCDDMRRTKELLVQLSAMPASVIIVGVGHRDFSAMEELDGEDGHMLRDNFGCEVHRDIVQFVEMKDASLRGNLAEQVLKELPGQVCGYMSCMGYQLEVERVDPEEVATNMVTGILSKVRTQHQISENANDNSEAPTGGGFLPQIQ